MKSAPVKSSTQDHLDISDIRDDVVILRDNSAAIVVQTAAINFELLSESEQDSIIYSYAGLLNSLNFTTQVVVRSKKIDLSNYLQLITDAEARQANPDIKRQIYQYRQFIQTIVQQNNVLEKKFYLVIPFNPLELGVKGAALGNISRDTSHLANFVETVKTNLYPKRDHLIKQFSRLGIRSKQLTTQELIELYFDIYNPSEVGLQKITEAAGSYTTPIVSPAVSAAATAATSDTGQPQQPALSQPYAPPAQPEESRQNTPAAASTPPNETITSMGTPVSDQSVYAAEQTPPQSVNPSTQQSPQTTAAPDPSIDPDILKALEALKAS